MKSKEEKLREALNEYFGRDVGDVKGCFIGPASPTDYVPECPVDHTKQITILTKQHVPTFAEKRKELVDQLDKDLREIDVDLSAKEANNGLVDIYIKGNKKPLFTVYGDADLPAAIQLCDAVLSFRLVKKVMSTITEFLRALNYLGRQYKDETI